MIYAGIGSRETPVPIQMRMTTLAILLAEKQWTLRTGGAVGADEAFRDGCVRARGECELYLPWKRFNNHMAGFLPAKKAFEIAAQYHPKWSELKAGAKALHARNVHQVLGIDLNTPAKMIACWTTDGQASGGTGQALRIAKALKIPVFNFYYDNVTVENILKECEQL